MFAGEFVVRGRQERETVSALRHKVLAVAVGAFHERDEFRRGPAFSYPACHRLKTNYVRRKSCVFAGCQSLALLNYRFENSGFHQLFPLE
jgi:hypothetical protein